MEYTQILTIKQEEAIEVLLMEFTSNPSNTDAQIQQIIKNAHQQTRTIANSKLRFHRGGVNIQQEDFDITNIVQQVSEITHHDKPLPKNIHQKQSTIFEEFNNNEMEKLKLEQEQFVKVEKKYPKVKDCLHQKIQYPCVNLFSAKAQRWFAFNGKDIADVSDAVLFTRGDVQFRIYCMDEELYCFTNVDNFSQALVTKPNKGKTITQIALSNCRKYIVIGMINQIVLYEVNSHKSISVVKNITDLKVKQITNIGFCGNGFQRIFVVDSCKELVIVSIQSTFIFLRVEASRMDVCLSQIMFLDSMKLLIDEDEYFILAIGSRTQVTIYMVSPVIQLLHIQNFQDQLVVARLKSNCQGNTVNDHSVGLKWRYDSTNNIKPQLIISFWNRIIILKMTEANNDIIPFVAKFDRFLFYTNHYPITGIELLTYNHLLILSMKNVVVLAIPLITSFEGGEECEQSSIVYVNSSVYNKMFKSCPRKVMLLSDSKIDVLEILRLEEYIDKQVSQKSDYMNIFSLLMLVCKGLNYCFDCTYSEAELTKIVFYSIESLLISLSKVKTDDTTLSIRLYWVCELLIQTKRQHLIWSLVFSTVNNTLKKVGVLFECLELFFLKQLIHTVPAEIFNLIVEDYVSRERSKVLLKAVLSVDLEGHNVQRYLQLINQKHMHSLFIYLFQNINEQGDYLTPFIKIFASFNSSTNIQQKQYMGKLSLWYLYKSIRGYKFPQIAMTKSERQICWNSLLIQPLNPSIAKRFLDFSEELYLTIYLYVCTFDEIIEYIQQNSVFFAEQLRSFDCIINPEQPIFMQIVSFIKKICVKPSPIIYQFIAVCSLKIPIEPELLFQTSLYYLSNPNLLEHTGLSIINPVEKDQGKILLNMLMLLRPLLKSNRLYLKKLLAHKTYHWEVVSYLHFLDNKYQVAIQKLLDSEKRDHIFILLKQIIKSLQQSELPLAQLHSIITVQVGRLIKVNSRQTLVLLNLLKINIEVVLKQLKRFPELKLQFITSMILYNESEGREQNMTLLVDHLELVCQFDYKNVMSYLHHINYPLDEATKICERYNHFQGKAYMLQRSGDILSSLHSYEKAIISKIKEKEILPSVLKTFISKYFQSSITLCKNNPCSSLTPIQQNNWLCLMEITKDIQDSKHSQKVDVMIELNNYFTKIYEHLFNHVPAKILLEYFLKGNRGFLPRVLLKTWHTLSILFKFEHSMYRMAIETNIIDTTRMVDVYSEQKWRGILSLTIKCSFCDHALTDQKELVYFSCGHFFHKVCHKSKVCLVCKFESDSLLVKSYLDKIIRRRKESECWSVNKPSNKLNNGIVIIDIDLIEQRRKKLRPKLKAFDFEQMKIDNELQQSINYYFNSKVSEKGQQIVIERTVQRVLEKVVERVEKVVQIVQQKVAQVVLSSQDQI